MTDTTSSPDLNRVLTGITTTGTPHLGNYVGAIKPAIAASQNDNTDSFLFLADYHAMIKSHEPDKIHQSSIEIAATWLALAPLSGRVVTLLPATTGAGRHLLIWCRTIRIFSPIRRWAITCGTRSG